VRLALLSDQHANDVAFRAVLEDVEHLGPGVTGVLPGDLVEPAVEFLLRSPEGIGDGLRRGAHGGLASSSGIPR
jgi:hypothetical protein